MADLTMDSETKTKIDNLCIAVKTVVQTYPNSDIPGGNETVDIKKEVMVPIYNESISHRDIVQKEFEHTIEFESCEECGESLLENAEGEEYIKTSCGEKTHKCNRCGKLSGEMKQLKRQTVEKYKHEMEVESQSTFARKHTRTRKIENYPQVTAITSSSMSNAVGSSANEIEFARTVCVGGLTSVSEHQRNVLCTNIDTADPCQEIKIGSTTEECATASTDSSDIDENITASVIVSEAVALPHFQRKVKKTDTKNDISVSNLDTTINEVISRHKLAENITNGNYISKNNLVGDNHVSKKETQDINDASYTCKTEANNKTTRFKVAGLCFPCPKCPIVLNCKSNLKKHVRTHTTTSSLTCEVCSKKFIRGYALMQHMKIHSGDNEHECDQCGKKFNNKSDFRRHYRIHIGIKAFQCPHCEKSFLDASRLQDHAKIHTSERPYKCDLCDKAYIKNSDLTKHHRTHTKERDYGCSKCGKMFPDLSHLHAHTTTHEEDRRYSCDQCNKSFAYLCYLRRHYRVHSGEKPYICTVCSKAFAKTSHLRRHQMVHSGDKPFRCRYCTKTFADDRSLKIHLLDHGSSKKVATYEILIP